MAKALFELKLKVVGAMKRSTLGRQSTDPIERATNDILHWSWSTRLQIDRLRSSLGAEFAAWNLKPQVRSRRHFSTTSFDEHVVLVAAANLSRALDSAPKALRKVTTLGLPSARGLRLLRDVYEHWDQLRPQVAGQRPLSGGAAEKLANEFPGAEPWSLTFTPGTGEIVLANVVNVDQLVVDLRRLEAGVLRAERRRRCASTDNRQPV